MVNQGARVPQNDPSLRSAEFRHGHRFVIRIRSKGRKTRAGVCLRVHRPLEPRPIDGVA